MVLNLCYSKDITEILKEVQEVMGSQMREDISSQISSSYNPFDPIILGTIEQNPQEGTEEIPVESLMPNRLQAIFGNKAKIDGIWLKKGDEIKGYRVEKIKRKSVYLSRGDENLTLKLFENINIKEFN